jgi:hypothetical protein
VRRQPILRFVLPLALLACGCAPERFPLPMTAAELVTYAPPRSGPALVAYLGQPDASPTVCDLRATGPHLRALGEDVRASLVRALADGKVDPKLWRHCTSAVLRSAPSPGPSLLIDAIGHDYRSLLKSSDFEKLTALQDRVRVMQQLYIERENGVDGTAEVVEMFADLRHALERHRLGPAATVLGQELIATVDLEHGLWAGHPVDVPTMDTLYAAHDEKTLQRFVDRLPSPALRDEARRRIIRIHIAASQFPEVRDHAAAVEEIVMKQGAYTLALAEHPPVRGWLDASKMPARGVIVRQDLWAQTAKLLAYSGDRPGLSVLPEVKLRGAMLLEVKGISRPVTLCSPAKALDPTPCVAADQFKIENPAAYLDKDGAFHFVDNITMQNAVTLAQMRDKFVLPVSVAGQRMLSFEWRLSFERPADFVFSGPQPGTNGPALRVQADRRDPARFIFTVSGAGRPYLAVVETVDAPMFHISSRGAQGYTGDTGSSGSTGSSGGQCQDGGRGGDGGPGGPGGPGGNGGDVAAQVSCGGASCGDALALMQRMILSEAGPGGDGGSGGPGGSGGSGGSGRSPTTHTDADGNTVTDDPGCSGGSSGASGSNGPSGSPGSPGRAGRVSIEVAR